eukprot:scaffold156883_cov38-Prasinocladus_malaysianus.AAC.1
MVLSLASGILERSLNLRTIAGNSLDRDHREHLIREWRAERTVPYRNLPRRHAAGAARVGMAVGLLYGSIIDERRLKKRSESSRIDEAASNKPGQENGTEQMRPLFVLLLAVPAFGSNAESEAESVASSDFSRELCEYWYVTICNETEDVPRTSGQRRRPD